MIFVIAFLQDYEITDLIWDSKKGGDKKRGIK